MTVKKSAFAAAAAMTLAAGLFAPPAAVAKDITYCPYQVNATDVNVRPAPNKNNTPIKTISYPTKGLASQNLYSGSGLYWRKGFGGYVASQYLTRQPGPCAQ